MNDKKELTVQSFGERFTNKLIEQYGSLSGSQIQLTEQQRKLAQHLFIKCDLILKEAENKRLSKNENSKPAFTWANVNMQQLAADAIGKIELGLDALIDNHLHIVPYWIANDKKYQLVIQDGYQGIDYYIKNLAANKPKNIRYELVYSNDKLSVNFKSANNDFESYDFKCSENPFDRGDIVGGFAYIEYDDKSLNKLVLVSRAEIDKRMKRAKTDYVWKSDYEAMAYKSIVRAVKKHIPIDPAKIQSEFIAPESDIDMIDEPEVIDITPAPEIKQPENQDVKSNGKEPDF